MATAPAVRTCNLRAEMAEKGRATRHSSLGFSPPSYIITSAPTGSQCAALFLSIQFFSFSLSHYFSFFFMFARSLSREWPFEVLLGPPFGGFSGRRSSRSDIDALIDSLPIRPCNVLVFSSGPFAAKLLYRSRSDALSAFSDLWHRCLADELPLAPQLPLVDEPEIEKLIKPLFVLRLRSLLESKLVKQCESAIENGLNEIKALSNLLEKQSEMKVFEELLEKRKMCEMDLELVKKRLEEFKVGILCILKRLGEEKEGACEEEFQAVDVLNVGEHLDWNRVYRLMARECKRFEEGLPIYSYRREILKNLLYHQVIVLIGETGSGKSTQLVQFLVDSGLAAAGSVVCTQPRKLSAISLAQQVGKESDGCYADNFVVSYSTYFNSQVSESSAVFMTDRCFLQHCINDMSLAGVSYIILDEVHERSLNTDLLLALMKEKLLEWPELRLIIMSATADARKFADYFCASTFYVLGRNFPVEVKYIPVIASEPSYSTSMKFNSGNCASYVSDAVKMVNFIHKIEEDGGILAFLTSQMEVEWACENFNDPSARVLPMHGKLSYEEQCHVFQTFPGKRKIIFATNVAETSLTIPGVKYVVDTGMVKDSRLEPTTGMNVFKVGWTSQSSANQRAGRAGRTEPGKCYRLYSECDFHSMATHQEPKICKVHLDIAVLSILALGIKDVQNFDFIDAPSSEAIDKAVQNLIHLGAVSHKRHVFELTDTGISLVKLGVDPRLGKIILDSFSFGLEKEGLVLAAVMANFSSIFCRVGTDEEKFRADRLKVPFCHSDGDLFTLLSLYKEWEAVREGKNKWCWQNSVNAKTMRRCQETVWELESSVQYEFNMNIPSFWSWNPLEPTVHDVNLKKVIFSSLADNLAMYSGYDRLGYAVALTGQCLPLHPSCSLLVCNQRPSWVVFREITSESNQYLVCVTAIDPESVNCIQPSLFDVSQLESHKMQMRVIAGVGIICLRRLCGRQNCYLQSLIMHVKKVCMDNRIGIEVDFGKREIQLFASEKDMEMVLSLVNRALEREMKFLKDECSERCLFHGGDGTSATVALFGHGAEIKHLELEKRYLTVEVSHPTAHSLNIKEVLSIIDEKVSGIAKFCKQEQSPQEGVSTKWGRMTFLSPEAAEYAVAKLNELEVDGYPLSVIPIRAGNQRSLFSAAVRARVCWPRRPIKGAALINCAEEDAAFIVKDLSGLLIGEMYIKCKISSVNVNCVFVTGLPRDMTEPELRDALTSATRKSLGEINLLRGTAVDNSLTDCSKALVEEILPFMPGNHFPSHCFSVKVFNPQPKDYMMKATITFEGSLHLEAAKALDHIEGKVLSCCFPWQKIECQRTFHTSVFYPGSVFAVIKEQLECLVESFKDKNGVSCMLEGNEDGSVRVKLSAKGTKIVADLRKPLEQLMRGKILNLPNLTPSLMQHLLSREGSRLMKAVGEETGTYILHDRQNCCVRLFGSPKEVSAAEGKLIESVLAHQENKPSEIHLGGNNLPSQLMKEVVLKFGPDLHGLKARVPGADVVLNTRCHFISVRGSKEQKQIIESVVSELALSLSNCGVVYGASKEAECPICLCELEEPYNLESCGHGFCKSCLVDQCESAIRSHQGFPLCCTKNGCGSPMLLCDLKSLLSPSKMEELFWASLSAFVASSSGSYRFCPSPDCPGIYKVASKDAMSVPFFCGACYAETCTKCHMEYHCFLSCELYRQYREDTAFSLEDWRKGKEEYVKDCPSCANIIEKIEGCNHIECYCGMHICWLCLEAFSDSVECYSHLWFVHRAIQ